MKFLTFNLQHNKNHWSSRFPLVIEMLVACDADVIAFQEIALNIRQEEQIRSAMEKRGVSYQVFTEAKRGKDSKEGIGFFSRLPVFETDRMELLEGGRVAQRLTIRFDGRELDLITTHLHHLPPFSEIIRYRQMLKVMNWIRKRSSQDIPVIFAGDFNATPKSKTVRLVKQELASVFEKTTDSERPISSELPISSSLPITFPTPGQPVKFPAVTLDYIFVSQRHFQVISARRVGDQPARNGHTIYPSDHYGLLVEIQWVPSQQNSLTNP